MLNNCDDTLDELDLVHAKYWQLGVGKRSFSWDRVKFGKEKLEDVRGKLAVHISSINVYLQVVSQWVLLPRADVYELLTMDPAPRYRG